MEMIQPRSALLSISKISLSNVVFSSASPVVSGFIILNRLTLLTLSGGQIKERSFLFYLISVPSGALHLSATALPILVLRGECLATCRDKRPLPDHLQVLSWY